MSLRLGGRGYLLLALAATFVLMFYFYFDNATGIYGGHDHDFDLVHSTSSREQETNMTALVHPKTTLLRFQHRLQHMHEICENGKELWSRTEAEKYRSSWVRNDNFVIVPGRSFLVCVLPKCGSSSWHWLARDMREPLAAGHEFGWQDRQKNTEISQQLDSKSGLHLLTNKNAFLAIAVRHPFGKLISGWNEKLTRENTYASFLLEAYPLMKNYVSDKDKDHVISFDDFALYLANHGKDYKNLDYHFLPMNHLCQPCLYPYNHVVKLESLSLDEGLLKKELNVSNFPWQLKGTGYVTKENRNSIEIIRTYFKSMSKSTILKLIDIYYYDFVLFGYTFDVDSLTAGGFL